MREVQEGNYTQPRRYVYCVPIFMVVIMPILTTRSEDRVSKTAALTNVIELRPTTVLTTKHERPDDRRAYLTEDEVERLIKAAPTPRDRTMILVGYTHGLRVSELVNLRWNQINALSARISRPLSTCSPFLRPFQPPHADPSGVEVEAGADDRQPVCLFELPGRANDPPGVR
jgi:hypothetical protein